MWLTLVYGVVTLVALSHSYPSGAPQRACKDMIPEHTVKVKDGPDTKILPQNSSMPYVVSINPNKITKGFHVPIQVTISGKDGNLIRGFLLEARVYDPNKKTLDIANGKFTPTAPNTKTLNCAGGVDQNNAITHSSRLDVPSVTVEWTPIQVAHFVFIVTVVKSYDTFWKKVILDQIVEHEALPFDVPYEILPEIVDTKPQFGANGCGHRKGCYRYPAGCAPEYCEYFLSWTPQKALVNFEMTAKSDGWVAVGFSADKNMGDDSVIQCVYNEEDGTSSVGESYNKKDGKANEDVPTYSILSQKWAEYREGRMSCVFSRNLVAGASGVRDLNKPVYLLLAKGESKNGMKYSHDLSYYKGPIVSPDPVNLASIHLNIDGKATYPLIKAHAILMILAFVLCASTGMLIARYYKPMWPNRKAFGERLWFNVHISLMINCLIMVIIAFILIFVQVGGYSQMKKPWMALLHPIFGIIITCLVVLNPILALFRCDPHARCRPCFNWFHWLIGTLALVLATVNIFFGMHISKANIPWWVTWVMLIWVIIHFIVEITLEIHQCCVHKKNKRRWEDYDLKKRSNIHGELIRHPEPAGRRFKNGMLAFYITITIILVLIMVISILILS